MHVLWLTGIGSTCCDQSVVHVLQLGSDELCYCSAAVTFYFLCIFVNYFVACIAVVSLGVMIGMSGESWHHKSTLSPIPSSQDWACLSSSFLLCFRLRHFLIFIFSIYFFIIMFIYLLFKFK